MPRLWEETIDAHRDAVRAAIFDAASDLVAEGGPTAVTMAALAQRAGVGRATLYRYFPDTSAVLVAWHESVVSGHLAEVRAAAAGEGAARDRLVAALTAYVHAMSHRSHDAGAGASHSRLEDELHSNQQVATARVDLLALLVDLIEQAVQEGAVRTDVPPRELAEFCVAAASASPHLTSGTATSRLVGVISSALAPSAAEGG